MPMTRNSLAPDVIREDGVLILSGGLTIHNLRDFSCFSEETARSIYKDFDKAILDAVIVRDVRAVFFCPSFLI